MSKLIPLVLSSLSIFLTGAIKEEKPFQYAYEIRANSYAIKDSVNLYYYKENLIDIYENLVFDLDARYHQAAIECNLNLFKIDESTTPYYKEGRILLIIGKGKGEQIKGRLRKNACDEDVIREKYYLFDIFK